MLAYPFAEVHRVAPDGTIKLSLRRQFISTSLAGELVGLYVLDERYIQVGYSNGSKPSGYRRAERTNNAPGVFSCSA